MKKLCLIFIIVLLTILFSSCEFTNIETTERIKPPDNNTPPILGEWKIEKYKKSSENGLTDEEAKKFLDKKVLFHEKVVVIGDDVCLNPSYKINNVSTSDYLLYQYKVKPEYLGIESKNIRIITLTSEEKLFYEFIKEKDGEIIVNIDGVFFYLTKISDNLNEKELKEYVENEKAINYESLASGNSEILRTGILLGLRYYEESEQENRPGQWKYRTLWISSKNKTIGNIYETEDIFLPRKTGFWKVGMNRVNIDNKLKDVLYAYPLSKEFPEMYKYEDIDEAKESIIKTINYLGNDYISLESFENFPKGKVRLNIFPIDNINSGNPVKISDIIGENGQKAFYESAAREFSSDYKSKNDYLDIKPQEDSFGLTRRNGHWIMKGRINVLEEDRDLYKDFNIKIIPPKELVMYDELSVSWNEVKHRVPEALDVFTSPNEDIALILTHNNILIYTIDQGKLSKEYIRKIKLNDSEAVVMAEWATGKYIYTWEEEFLKNMASVVEE